MEELDVPKSIPHEIFVMNDQPKINGRQKMLLIFTKGGKFTINLEGIITYNTLSSLLRSSLYHTLIAMAYLIFWPEVNYFMVGYLGRA